jgi:hypothetical protein
VGVEGEAGEAEGEKGNSSSGDKSGAHTSPWSRVERNTGRP